MSSVSYPTPSQGRPSNSLHFVVGEMNGKLDQLIANLLPQLQSIQSEASSLEARVVVLEELKWRAAGAGAVVVFLITAWEIIRYVFLPN